MEKIEIKLKECCLTCEHFDPSGIKGIEICFSFGPKPERVIACGHMEVCSMYNKKEIKQTDIEKKEITFSIEGKTYTGFLREERLEDFSRDYLGKAHIREIGFIGIITPKEEIPKFTNFKMVTIGDSSSEFYMGDSGNLIEVNPRKERY